MCNSDYIACICMWSYRVKVQMCFSGNISGLVLDIIFYQDAIFKSTAFFFLSFFFSFCPEVSPSLFLK